MPKKGYRKPRPIIGDAGDREGMYAWMKRYLEWLKIKNYSERTVENREVYLEFFIKWSETRSLSRPQEITKPILERYQRHLFHLRKDNGKPLSFRAQHCRLVPVRAYFKWLTQQNVLLSNPASEIELPKLERRLPRHVLSREEAEAILEQPDLNEPLGLRDRAILEVLYSTGIRRSEVLGLSIYDLDAERGTLMVRQGKGKKDRMVPIGERAIVWVERYRNEVRPGFVVPPDEGTLFLTSLGEGFAPSRMTQLVRGYVRAADIGKSGEAKTAVAPAPRGEWRSGCRNREQIAQSSELGPQWMISGPLSVAGVRMDDHLNLRAAATYRSETIKEIPHNATELLPTGNVCKIGRTPWYQVSYDHTTGWVSGKFVRRATKVRDVTRETRKHLSRKHLSRKQVAATPAALVQRLKEEYEKPFAGQTEGHHEVRILGVKVAGQKATATLHSCCFLDDSVAGEQVVLEMQKVKGGWSLSKATSQTLCYRSVATKDNLCN